MDGICCSTILLKICQQIYSLSLNAFSYDLAPFVLTEIFLQRAGGAFSLTWQILFSIKHRATNVISDV